MILMVIIFRRCMSYLVSSKLPNNLHLCQASFPLMGLVSGMVYSSGFFHLHVDYKHLVVQALWLWFDQFRLYMPMRM